MGLCNQLSEENKSKGNCECNTIFLKTSCLVGAERNAPQSSIVQLSDLDGIYKIWKSSDILEVHMYSKVLILCLRSWQC